MEIYKLKHEAQILKEDIKKTKKKGSRKILKKRLRITKRKMKKKIISEKFKNILVNILIFIIFLAVMTWIVKVEPSNQTFFNNSNAEKI